MKRRHSKKRVALIRGKTKQSNKLNHTSFFSSSLEIFLPHFQQIHALLVLLTIYVITCIPFLCQTQLSWASEKTFSRLKICQQQQDEYCNLSPKFLRRFNVNIVHSNRRESDFSFFFFLIYQLTVCPEVKLIEEES